MPWIDLHLHTSASSDCLVPPELVLARCRRLGLGPVFLTDHDTVEGARKAQALRQVRVVIGQEITTSDGELIGLFLREAVEPGQTALETAREIHRQGGLVYLQHPYDPFRRHLREECLEEVAPLVDVVEVYNARADEVANRRAADLCEILNAAPGAGSDGHTLGEIGAVYVSIEPFDGAADFLAKLRRSRIVRRPNRLLMTVRSRLGRGS